MNFEISDPNFASPDISHRQPTTESEFLRDPGAGGMRPQAVEIRRPLRSNGQRVVNDTQKLSSNPFANANTSVTCSARY